MTSVVGGLRYPGSAGEFGAWFGAWFGTDADCLDCLEWLRWPGGFVCLDCGHRVGWRMADGRFRCGGCDGRTSVTAGTIVDKTRTPLTVWFTKDFGQEHVTLGTHLEKLCLIRGGIGGRAGSVQHLAFSMMGRCHSGRISTEMHASERSTPLARIKVSGSERRNRFRRRERRNPSEQVRCE